MLLRVSEQGPRETPTTLKGGEIATKGPAILCDNQCGEDLSAIPDVDSPLPNKDTVSISTVNTRKQKTSQVVVGRRQFLQVERRQIFVTNLWDQEHELK